MQPNATLIKELEEQRPHFPVGLLSRREKDRAIERSLVALYRWYLDCSQTNRDWNPDKSFQWHAFRTDHSPELNHLLEGFYAVEQYIPDYVMKMLVVVKQSHGRALFQIRWGSEEQKHTEGWLNTIRYARHRSPQWIEDYTRRLRETEWTMRWDDPLRTLFYTLIQERATQMSYLNTAAIARGLSDNPAFAHDVDPVLERVCRTIAVDEAAHFNFFLEAAHLFFYYYPAQSLDALVDVIKYFVMPAADVIPNYHQFEEEATRAGIFTIRGYLEDVLQVVLKHLSLNGLKALTAGVRRSRQVPDPDGNMRDTALFEAIDYGAVQAAVQRLHRQITKYERATGRDAVDPTYFVPSGLDAFVPGGLDADLPSSRPLAM